MLTPAILATPWLVAEILFLAHLLYQLLLVIRETRGVPVFLGLIVVATLYQVSGWLGFGAMRWLIESVPLHAALAIMVMLQARSFQSVAFQSGPTVRLEEDADVTVNVDMREYA